MSQSPSALPRQLLHDLFGTFLVGTWLSSALFALELAQVYRYLKLYPISWSRTGAHSSASTTGGRQDRAWIPIMITWMLIMDSASTVTLHMMAYTVRKVSVYAHASSAYKWAVACGWLGQSCNSGRQFFVCRARLTILLR